MSTSRYHLNSSLADKRLMTIRLKDALEFAVTGKPVNGLLSQRLFFVNEFRRLRQLFAVEASSQGFLLYQRSGHLLLLNGWNYMREARLRQENQAQLITEFGSH